MCAVHYSLDEGQDMSETDRFVKGRAKPECQTWNVLQAGVRMQDILEEISVSGG